MNFPDLKAGDSRSVCDRATGAILPCAVLLALRQMKASTGGIPQLSVLWDEWLIISSHTVEKSLFFARRVVADCSTALDAPRRVNRSRLRQQRLGQCSLAAARLADERDRPDVLDGIRHGPASSLLRVIPESDNGQAVHTRIPHAS